MKREIERIETMTEIISELNISATEEQIKKIVSDFSLHIEMENELNSYQHISHEKDCTNCKILQEKLKTITKERDIYHNSVRQRRNTDQVWIEGDSIMYGGR